MSNGKLLFYRSSLLLDEDASYAELVVEGENVET